ncbi:glycosyltransferase family 4 protein [Paenibacillus sedimenti]|uniref:Glycosyltransferase family 4 protein n=1 Tax=Paenibacillus sedimenti TaxID=2770274 RepID=A0A926KT92_9BACL|nr:glycosyltransferase family 4 protein [Paenibacillus sedimenti]MBD0381575.1 glycosyltransferase family 4 protein [Paenibacillus sedimenti]
MKIALINSDLLPCPPIRSGAVPLLIHSIAPILARLDNTVTVFSIQDPSLPNYEMINHVEFIRFDRGQYIEEVLQHLNKHFFDIIQVFNTPRWILRIKNASPQSRLTLSLHNLMLGERLGDNESRKVVETIDYMITVSKFVAQHVVKQYPAASGKMTALYTGENASRYTPHFSNQGRVVALRMKRQLGIPDHFQVVLFVGRLEAKKGCHCLIEAMKMVRKQHPETALVIVGSKWFGDLSVNPYIRKIQRRARQVSKYIYFTNFLPVNGLPDYYTMSDVFVCPSQWQEPLARVHYEAMAAGLPIVTSNRGGNPEVIAHGKNGFVNNQYDKPEAFAKYINKLLKDKRLREKMGNINKKLIKNKYNFEQYALKLTRLYKKIK